MKHAKQLPAIAALVAFAAAAAPSATADPVVFINEIHYDNDGGDSGEFVEVAGTAGTDLSTWSLLFYNGADGTLTGSALNLTGTIADQQNGFGTLSFLRSGIQNGAPDGLALVNSGLVVQFLSYEGSFTATNGLANGMLSVDIGVSEPGSTPVGHSLQLAGTGSAYADFTWSGPSANTSGAVNTGQSFQAAGVPDTGATFALFALSLIALPLVSRKLGRI